MLQLLLLLCMLPFNAFFVLLVKVLSSIFFVLARSDVGFFGYFCFWILLTLLFLLYSCLCSTLLCALLYVVCFVSSLSLVLLLSTLFNFQ